MLYCVCFFFSILYLVRIEPLISGLTNPSTLAAWIQTRPRAEISYVLSVPSMIWRPNQKAKQHFILLYSTSLDGRDCTQLHSIHHLPPLHALLFFHCSWNVELSIHLHYLHSCGSQCPVIALNVLSSLPHFFQTSWSGQSSFRAPNLRGPLAALRSARLASSSFLLSSRFFLESSALLRPAWKTRRNAESWLQWHVLQLKAIHYYNRLTQRFSC